jgi:hypothetical protein
MRVKIDVTEKMKKKTNFLRQSKRGPISEWKVMALPVSIAPPSLSVLANSSS